MDRRNFTKSLFALGAGALLPKFAFAQGAEGSVTLPEAQNRPAFKTLFAPTFGHFKASAGKNPLDQLKFMYDMGFRAFEDNGMMGRSLEEQKAIAALCEKLGMQMGLFVAYSDFGTPLMAANKMKGERHADTAKVREFLKDTMTQACEVSKRMNNKYCTVVPGRFSENLDDGYQFVNIVEHLKFCSEICEKSGLIMVLEPLNPMDHQDLWLKKSSQAYALCKAVKSPSCKILFDVYHQQITEGNLIHNIDRSWSEIGYFQVGDVPGRKEAGTGEINYKKIFSHLRSKGYKGFVGLEHGQSDGSKAGDEKFIEAYRLVDA